MNMGNPVLTPILFDSTAADFIIDCFPHFKKECQFCKTEITIKNISGVNDKGFICNNFTCIVDFTKEDFIMANQLKGIRGEDE